MVDACLPPVHAVCRRMLGADAAADVAQDSILRIVRGLGAFDGRSAVTTWATRIAINACLGHLRRERHRRHAPLDPGTSGGGDDRGAIAGRIRPESTEPGPVERIELGEARSSIQRALDTLDPSARAILVLRDMQGLDYERIAEVLGVRTGTVKSRLFRARSALRDRLAELGHGPGADVSESDDGSAGADEGQNAPPRGRAGSDR